MWYNVLFVFEMLWIVKIFKLFIYYDGNMVIQRFVFFYVKIKIVIKI